ncbi:hypothetical protein [Parathermosynechococcus lividus]
MSQHLARLLTPILVILSTTSTAFALPRGGFGGGFGGVRAPSVGAERNFSNRFVDVHPTANWDNRVNTIDPNIRNIDNRPINSGNINSNRININNAGNTINWNRSNNVIVNPNWNRGNWWWHGGNPWYPNPAYWGGGFWGNLAVGVTSAAVAGAVAGSVSSPTVVVNSPGGQLLSTYGLVQVPCGGSVVVLYGPSGSVVCAQPTSAVPAGTYTIDSNSLSLIPQY